MRNARESVSLSPVADPCFLPQFGMLMDDVARMESTIFLLFHPSYACTSDADVARPRIISDHFQWALSVSYG